MCGNKQTVPVAADGRVRAFTCPPAGGDGVLEESAPAWKAGARVEL